MGELPEIRRTGTGYGAVCSGVYGFEQFPVKGLYVLTLPGSCRSWDYALPGFANVGFNLSGRALLRACLLARQERGACGLQVVEVAASGVGAVHGMSFQLDGALVGACADTLGMVRWR